ncbi:MAG: lambda-exonuclease family protein [Candidatus Limnocylindrales bacterium]
MTTAVRTGLRQGTPAWAEARRSLITSTAIPVLLGLSPFRCEADLADEMRSGIRQESSLRMRVGSALEDLIASEYTRTTGRPVQRMRDLIRHPSIEWAAASVDRRVVGEHRAVELKWTGSRTRFADGLPQDVEAQVVWALGVLGWERSDVAVLLGGEDLKVFKVEADPVLFANLVKVAEDFRRRLEAGGPFARDAARIRRDFPSDNGAEMLADGQLAGAVDELVRIRAERRHLEELEEGFETAIKARMGEVAVLRGDGFHVTWKRTKDREETDWRSLADGLLRTLPETERAAFVGLHTTVRPGFRPLRVVIDKEDAL